MRSIVSSFVISLCFVAISAFASTPAGSPTQELRRQAEAQYAQHSYAIAHGLYAKIDRAGLGPGERRWVDFRLADTTWRAAEGDEESDDTPFATARKALGRLIAETPDDDHDQVWAEANESLGGLTCSFDSVDRGDDVEAARADFLAALDWWAGQSDLEIARPRYLHIVFTMERPLLNEQRHSITLGAPREVLEAAVKIALSPADQARANLLLALDTGFIDPDAATAAFERTIALGKNTGYLDGAIYAYATWARQQGKAEALPNGAIVRKPDYALYLRLMRRLATEFNSGQTPYWSEAQRIVQEMTGHGFTIAVSNGFMTASDIQFMLSSMNVWSIDFVLYRVVEPRKWVSTGEGWAARVSDADLAVVRRWSQHLDAQQYEPHQESLFIDGPFPAGAYVLGARSGEQEQRIAILVSDLAIVTKASSKRCVVFACDALTGAPVANAEVVIRRSENRQRIEQKLVTGADGLVDLRADSLADLEVVAFSGGNIALDPRRGGQSYGAPGRQDVWRIYAITDRPAYRPGQDVQWKFIARIDRRGTLVTPRDEVLLYEVRDWRGNKIQSGRVGLNPFGSAWGSIHLDPSSPLGSYLVEFYDCDQIRIGQANLFQVEEYKLPEFFVTVSLPKENGHKKSYRLGDTVEADLAASYYFGGPVANATVDVSIEQSLYTPKWTRPRDYPWYYEEERPGWNGAERTVMRKVALTTDAGGHARITIPTAALSTEAIELLVHASVIDASRREVSGVTTIRVSNQPYFAFAVPRHFVTRPRQKVTVDFTTLDVNDNPVSVAGEVRVRVERFREVWISPEGHELAGEELRRRRQVDPAFPGNFSGWRRKSSQTIEEETGIGGTVTTDANGEAAFEFVTPRDGIYRVDWIVKGAATPAAGATTAIWCGSNETVDLELKNRALHVIVDKEQLRVGSTAQVMIVAPSAGRTVLFSVEGSELFDVQLIRMGTTVHLVDFPVDELLVPQIFVAVASVAGGFCERESRRIVVPPEQHFLHVEVHPGAAENRPRDDTPVTVSTRDWQGRPVSAEVSLAVADESIYAISEDKTSDPRSFFYGNSRLNFVNTTSSVDRFLARVKRSEYEKALEIARLQSQEQSDQNAFDPVPLLPGGYATFGSVSEAITVTASAPAVLSELPPGRFFMQELTVLPPRAATSSVTVRSDFRETALWLPAIVTDARGLATANIHYPDSVTTWRFVARAITVRTDVGESRASALTQQPIMVRLEAPRFFVEGDRGVVSAIIDNSTDGAITIRPSLVVDGGLDAGIASTTDLVVDARGQRRIDWPVRARRSGPAMLRVTAEGRESDSMQREIPIVEHGIEKRITLAGKARASVTRLAIDLPAARRKDQTRLTVQVTPSIAVTMLDALPYLVNDPYGCVEQTMSRFLPAAITAATLRQLGISTLDVSSRLFGGIEQKSAAETHPNGRHLDEMNQIIDVSLLRLYDAQNGEGAWGWWKDGPANSWMTAYVVWGLTIASKAQIDVDSRRLQYGREYLRQHLVDARGDHDLQAWMLHALAEEGGRRPAEFESTALTNLWDNRDGLRAYGRALFAISLESFGQHDRAMILVGNLENGVKIDRSPDQSILAASVKGSATTMATAHWGLDHGWWHWAEGSIESTAFALSALMRIEPENGLVEPAMNWLVKNRRGAQWSNTRDTAIVILALDEYLARTKELEHAASFTVWANDVRIGEVTSAAGEMSAPSNFDVDRTHLRDGRNEIRIEKSETSPPLYFSATATYFSLEEPIRPAGHELFVRRDYERLKARPTLLKGYLFDRDRLEPRTPIRSGEHIEVVQRIESKNDYEYLVFEDLKPAGLEATSLVSEEVVAREVKPAAMASSLDATRAEEKQPDQVDYTGRTVSLHAELRDRKISLFADRLPQGLWEIGYELRAETPGEYHALPLTGQAMYAPEIYANGEEERVVVGER